jgi:hypothetical protein
MAENAVEPRKVWVAVYDSGGVLNDVRAFDNQAAADKQVDLWIESSDVPRNEDGTIVRDEDGNVDWEGSDDYVTWYESPILSEVPKED